MTARWYSGSETVRNSRNELKAASKCSPEIVNIGISFGGAELFVFGDIVGVAVVADLFN
jgi:hypothetical protein